MKMLRGLDQIVGQTCQNLAKLTCLKLHFWSFLELQGTMMIVWRPNDKVLIETKPWCFVRWSRAMLMDEPMWLKVDDSKRPNQDFHLYCQLLMKWMKWNWVACKLTNGWWSDQRRIKWSSKKAKHRSKGAQLGFLGSKGSLRAKVKQIRVWGVHEVSWCNFTRLMHNQWFDIRVSSRARTKHKAKWWLVQATKEQRIRV